MERLTFEVHDGGIFVKESDVKTFKVEDEIMHTGNAIKKLSEYENLEEQGRLRRKERPLEITEIHLDEYRCPACGAENGCDDGIVTDNYCPECGQKIFQKKMEAKGLEPLTSR